MPIFPPNTAHAIKTIVLSSLGLGVLVLLIFGPRAGQELPNDRVIVDYWEHWTGDEEAGMRVIVNHFNDTVGREKHIFVRYLSTSDIEKKTLIATAAGVPPDIAGLYNQNIPQFAAQDALEPLDNLAAAHGITPDTYKKVFWDECCYEGHLYGLVSTAFDLGLYYNTEIFQERADVLRAKGLDPNRAPRTIAELDAYAAALDQYDSSGRLISAGYIPLEPGWYQNYTCVFFGGSWWDKINHRFTFTDPGVVRAYTWIQSYSKKLGAHAETEFRAGFGNFDSPQNAFLAGIVAMEQQGTFFANFILKQKPSMRGKWAAAPFPAFDPSLKDPTYCNCDVLVIPRRAEHKAEAFEFIAFVNRQDQMEKLALSHCKISPLAKVSEEFLTHHTNPYIRVFDQLAASPNAHPTEPVPILPEVNDEMNEFVQKLATLQVTPEDGLKQMQDRLQKKYDDFVAEQQERRGGSP
jgi:ABC-type glycerol-3-phosphate transport system substrate-binding protein